MVSTPDIGAFVDWGLPKDLLVPFSGQTKPMEVGHSYTVYVYVDEHTDRIVASCKLSKFLSEEGDELLQKQAVDLLICQRTDLGYMAVIDNTHLGLLFDHEILQPVKFGQRLKGYIKEIRSDKKIGLCLQFQGQEARAELSPLILDDLKKRGGTSLLTDKSSPDDIFEQFNVSKGNYKRALGSLYKERLISIERDKITLLEQ